jgi:hypothetical protein
MLASPVLPWLYLPTKTAAADQNTDRMVIYRTLERWSQQISAAGGGITRITSVDGSVTITNPTGPTTDLHVAAGGGLYASLTGSGETVTPGGLVQAGGLTINTSPGDPGGSGFHVAATGFSGSTVAASIDSSGGGNIRISTGSGTPGAFPGILLYDSLSLGATGSGVSINSLHGSANVTGQLVNLTANGSAIQIQSAAANVSGQTYLQIWASNGVPTVAPAGSTSNFCFDTAGRHIYTSNPSTGAWSLLV